MARDTSFYNEFIQNINNRQQQTTAAIDSNLANIVQPWVDLSTKAKKIAFDQADKKYKRDQARANIAQINKVRDGSDTAAARIKDYENKKKLLNDGDIKIYAAALKLHNKGHSNEIVERLKSMSSGSSFGTATVMAKEAANHYPVYLNEKLSSSEQLIDLTSIGGRQFKINEAQTETELKAAIAEIQEEYYVASGLESLNPLIVNDKAWDDILKAENKVVKAKQKQDRIDKGFADTELAKAKFRTDGDFVSLLNAVASSNNESGTGLIGLTKAKKMGIDTIKKMAANPNVTYEDLEAIIDGIAEQVPGHMGKKSYGQFDPDFIAELREINTQALIDQQTLEDNLRDVAPKQMENAWEDYKKNNEVTEKAKEDFANDFRRITGQNPTFMQNDETRQDTIDDKARVALNRTEFLRGYLTKEDLLPYSDTIRTEFLDQVKKGEDLRKFDEGYADKIEKLIDTSIAEAQNLNWFNKGGDLELEMKDIMEADIESMTRDLLTQYTPRQAYEQIKDHVRAKINTDGKNLYLEDAKRAIKNTFDKGTTREFRKDLSKAMNALAYNPSQYDKLVVVDKEHLDQAEKYRDTAQEGDPVPQIYSMIAKEFPTLEAFDIMNGQLKAAGLKPVDKPQIEQDIDKAPDNLLRTLRCQPTQTGLARCYVEVQRLKGEDENGYQMDWSNPEFLTPGLEMTDTFPLPAGEKLIK